MVHIYYHIYAIEGVDAIVNEQLELIKAHFDFPYKLNIGISIANDNTSIANILNLFNISDSSKLQVAVYDEGDNLVGSVRTISSGTTMNLLNLWSDYDYYVVVTGEYSGVTGEVARYSFHTQAKEIQPLVVTNLVLDLFTVQFNVNGVQMPDPSNVISSSLFVNLYMYSDITEEYELLQSSLLNSGDNEIIFNMSKEEFKKLKKEIIELLLKN